MNFGDFIIKYSGQPVDTDGAYGYQCMDLMHKFKYDVLNLLDPTLLQAPAAKYVYLNFRAEWGTYFEKIPNTPTGVPKAGDIVLWNGIDGHVAIFVNGNVMDFISFDQNFPVGSLPHTQYHNYYNVLGWLRKRVI